MTRKASHKIIALSAANALPFERQSNCGRSFMCVISKDYLLLTHPTGQRPGNLD
jgi:aromatic ring-opening dioxygenase catalytic subunit (LigB family)